MRIAWFTPYYASSAIGTYSESIVGELVDQGHDVTVFAPNSAQHGGIRPSSHRCLAIGESCDPLLLREAAAHDIAVYNMGNNITFHQEVFEYSKCEPGIVVLHDLVMRDFFWMYFIEHLQSRESLYALLEKVHGPEAREHMRKLVDCELPRSLDDANRLRWPLCRPVVSNSLGVVVHSEYARGRLSECGISNIKRIDFPRFGPTAGFDREDLPVRSSAKSGLRILTFGYLNANKLIHETIHAIGDSPILRDAVQFEIIGEDHRGYREEIDALIERMNLQATVKLLGFQPDDVLREHILAADIVVNLRNPHQGESSATLVSSLLAGVPTVVWKHGYYAEFPEEIVCQIDQTSQLREVLERLVTRPDERLRRGEASRRHALDRFRTERFVADFIPFAEHVMRRRIPCKLIDHATQRLKEIGALSSDRFVQKIAEEIARMTPHDPPLHSARRSRAA